MTDNMTKLKELNSKTYREQAIWFLNAFWKAGPVFADESSGDAENVWLWQAKCVDLDKKGEDGFELDEFQAHQLLESIGNTLSVKDMRDMLKEVDVDFNKMVSLTEFLIYKFKIDWNVLVNASQGNPEDDVKLALAQEKMDASAAAITAAKAAEAAAIEFEKQAKGAEKEAIHAEMEAKSAEAAAVKAETEAKAAESIAFEEETVARAAEEKAKKAEAHQLDLEAQVAKALAELQCEEDAYNNKCASLLATSTDASCGQVKRGTAAAELAQLKAGDPMPLQRAKINQEAVLRRQQKATKSAAAARVAASSARSAAEAARLEAVAAREEAESTRQRAASRREAAVSTRAAAESTRKKAEESRAAAVVAVAAAVDAYAEAVAYLEKVKLEVSAAGKGKIWWMDRELTERKKYMSQKQLAMLAAKEANQ